MCLVFEIIIITKVRGKYFRLISKKLTMDFSLKLYFTRASEQRNIFQPEQEIVLRTLSSSSEIGEK